MYVRIFITAVYFYFTSLKFQVIKERTIIVKTFFRPEKIFILKGGNLFSTYGRHNG
jgi:hypothetical protein